MGQIKGISKNGLAFFYTAYGGGTTGGFELDIFYIEKDSYLKKLPVMTVLDRSVKNKVSLSSLPTKQMSMQFGKIGRKQKLLLDYFLEKYTHRGT